MARSQNKSIFFTAIKMQDVDMRHYDQVNFNDPEECFNYFFQLKDCCLSSDDMTEEARQSAKEFKTTARANINVCHTPMRQAAEDIHREFQRFASEPHLARGILVTGPTTRGTMALSTTLITLLILESTGKLNHLPPPSTAVEGLNLSGSGSGYGALG